MALSYGWWERAHPDPCAEQLVRLLPIFECLVEYTNRHGGLHATVGVLWDFCAFPQQGWTAERGQRFIEAVVDDRTPTQRNRFSRGL